MQKEETPLKKGVSLNFFIVYLSILAKFGKKRLNRVFSLFVFSESEVFSAHTTERAVRSMTPAFRR